MSKADSSSSDEDLTAFQSVVVSFEEITSQSVQIALQARKRIAGSRNRSRPSEHQHAGDAGGPQGEQHGGGEDEAGPLDQLNPVQTKVAAALDSLLEGRLKVKLPGPKRLRREARAAGQAEEAEAAAQAAGGAFRFFSRVPPGLAPVLEPEELPALPSAGAAFPDTFRRRRAPPAEQAAAALPALAVDGAALLAAAGGAWAAGGGGGGGGGGPAKQQQQQQPKKKKARVLGEGVVLEGRPFVPHEERMRRLVGGPAAAAAGVAC